MAIEELWYEGFGIGIDPKDLTILQVCLRSVLVFLAALMMVRVADKRFLSKMSAFDVILGFILASSLARAINGSAPLTPTLVMGFLLVGFHWVLAWLSRRSRVFGKLVKGREDVLLENDRLNQRALRRNNLSEADLLEAARQQGHVENLAQVRKAVLERSGYISILPKD
jgi:uncharacterized membrane protein YcaP (DUF421 family)